MMARDPFDELQVDLGGLAVPNLADYFGLWSVYEPSFRALLDGVRALDVRAHVAASQAMGFDARMRERLQPVDGVVVLPLSGVLMKSVPSMTAGTSTVWARQVVRAAANDERVRTLVLRIDSPGGPVAGIHDLVDDLWRAREFVRTASFIEDLGASAGYEVASATERIFAGRTALVGGIGTFMAVADYSAQAAMEGVRVHVLSTGGLKGAGVPGTPITDAQLAEWQRLVDELGAAFVGNVAKGRGMGAAAVRVMADGRVHGAADARRMGLIDQIATIDQVMAWARSRAPAPTATAPPNSGGARNQTTEEIDMAEEATKARSHEATKGTEETVNAKQTKEKAAEVAAKPADAPPAAAAVPAKSVEAVEAATGVLRAAETAASIEELSAALPKADDAFLVSCLRGSLSIAQARARWTERLEQRLAAADAELTQLRAASRPAPAYAGESRPAAADADGGSAGSATAEWNERLARMKKANPELDDRAAAVRLAGEAPALHRAYIAEANAKK